MVTHLINRKCISWHALINCRLYVQNSYDQIRQSMNENVFIAECTKISLITWYMNNSSLVVTNVQKEICDCTATIKFFRQ